MCDFYSIEERDLRPADRASREYVGEIYCANYNSTQKWYWISGQSPEEVLLLKNFDSKPGGEVPCELPLAYRLLCENELTMHKLRVLAEPTVCWAKDHVKVIFGHGIWKTLADGGDVIHQHFSPVAQMIKGDNLINEVLIGNTLPAGSTKSAWALFHSATMQYPPTGNIHLPSQESRLVTWILLQEALGYAPSHSQVRATVAALLRQQGRERHIGVHWLARFIKRHPDIKTKVGKRQEAARFNSFTPMAVNWYFGIRASEYGWIKRENTVNVNEGGIMAGFGLESLVIGSSNPRRKAFLKGSQSHNWTSFNEAVTADGRLLKPGIIFKGKELQKQWLIDEFNKIADWYYITSDNGWTDNHIALEWLKQPLDNGVFNASKAAYRKELQKLASLTDSAPVDKVNFIKAYARARAVGMTKKNILSGWRVTGNWQISRRKAFMHPEIQPDKKETTPGSDGHRDGQVDSDHTPTTSRHIRDLGKNKSPSTRRRYSVISRGFKAQESKIASLSTRIASLEEEVGRLSRGKKRKAIPNPNKRFMTLAEVLMAGDTISEPNETIERADAIEDVIEVGGMVEDERSNSEEEELTVVRTRAGREVRRAREY
ncbi:unnamed protein product [Fusarium equiseti]|uniref:HTH CENPB-type domain-containing protein n=1 Tax=Fusarium equiseti TaxID=61235 RepID=A0A8J2IQ86_FUSEQ|nr:unnamed protein product [Fusarium equiseti]